MSTATANIVLELLDALIEVELQMSRFYDAMVDFAPEHQATWKLLNHQEEAHARGLILVHQSAEKHPELFSEGKYTVATARHMSDDINAIIDKIHQRSIHPQYAVTFMRDVEHSLLESKLQEAVRTDVIEARKILVRIENETRQHRDLLRGISVVEAR